MSRPRGQPTQAALAPPRPGERHVNVPLLGIVLADDGLRRRVDRFFHWPMVVLALAILPLLVLDYMLVVRPAREGVLAQDWVFWLIRGGLTLIWLAFLIEFIVKIAVAECRWEYVRRNWLDVIIIMVPLLRPLRVAVVAKTSRIFTLRGVGMKLGRSVLTVVIGMEATERLLHRLGLRLRRDRTDPRDMTRHQLTRELLRLRRLADAWEEWYQHHLARLAARGEPAREDQLPAAPAVEADPEDASPPGSGAPCARGPGMSANSATAANSGSRSL